MDREPGTGPTVGPVLEREGLDDAAASAADSITARGDSVERPRDDGTLPGERGAARVAGSRTLQARITTGVGLAATVLVGLSFLGWYAGRPAREAEAAAAEQQRRTDAALSSEMRLPPLERPEPLPEVAATPMPTAATTSQEADAMAGLPEAGLYAGSAPGAPAGVLAAPMPADTAGAAPALPPALERRLGGPVLLLPTAASTMPAAMEAGAGEGESQASPARPSRPIALVSAANLPSRTWLLPRGAVLDCTLETAIDSTLPGLAACVLAADTFGADGRAVLLPRGTRLVGQVQSEVRAGQARVGILWQEARTPGGVVVALDSPATDAQGRTGLLAKVDRHFTDRFGAALLVSMIDAGAQALANSQRGGGTQVTIDPGGSKEVIAEVLRADLGIPPTLSVAPGTRVQVLVAAHLDFRGVEGVSPTTGP